MPLPIPSLDSRSWDELMAEARALIPEHAPEWTDHNTHDPGITLVELAAWLAEGLLFELDRVSPEKLRAFLRFVGVEPRPAGVAETVVVFRQGPGGAAAVHLPAGFQATDADRVVVFEGERPLTVSPAWLELDAAEGTSRGVLFQETEVGLVDVTASNAAEGRTILPFGNTPSVGDALRIGFSERPAAPGDELALYLWTPTWRTDGDEKRTDHYSAAVAWEYRDPTGWHALKVLADETRALTLSGQIVVRGPASHPAVEGRYWIRARLASGAFDCSPRLQLVAVNAASVRHAATAPQESLGKTLGTAGESFVLGAQPVVAGTTRLRLTRAGVDDDDWREVADWDRTGSADRHYLLDAESGTIAFGDGRRGKVPPAGTEVVARSYAVGGGATGNVPAGRLARLNGAGALIGLVQPLPATGGAPPESLSRAHGRALDELARPTRGVSADDFERLALATPGVPVGRVRTLPGHHPDFSCFPAAGVVTVVVLPRCGRPPRPSAALLREVRRYLEQRRILGTEVHVVAPSYVPVSVSATLNISREAPSDLVDRAQAALAAFLDPLSGGSDGSGWPFGRDVLESEVLAELSRLPGVRYVDDLGIAAGAGAPQCGNVVLCPTELPESGEHRFTVKEAS
jgi:predicted phage baseplate assembly protein